MKRSGCDYTATFGTKLYVAQYALVHLIELLDIFFIMNNVSNILNDILMMPLNPQSIDFACKAPDNHLYYYLSVFHAKQLATCYLKERDS